jgi:hypothetical protein
MGPIGLGLAFQIRRVSDDADVVLGAGNASVVYLVQADRTSPITLTLPAAAGAASRFVTITRVSNGRRITVRTRAGESIDGAASRIVLDDKITSVTLVTDGVEWVVVAQR